MATGLRQPLGSRRERSSSGGRDAVPAWWMRSAGSGLISPSFARCHAAKVVEARMKGKTSRWR
jgi:hypothetical protein